MKKNITYILIFFLSFFIIFILYKSLNKENVYIPEKVLSEKITSFSIPNSLVRFNKLFYSLPKPIDTYFIFGNLGFKFFISIKILS